MWSIGVGADGLALCIAEGVGELRGRFAKARHEDAVDGSELFSLARLEFFATFASCIGFAESKTIFAELEGNHLCHSTGVVGIVALGHHLGRHDTIFTDDVLHTGEGATIADGIAEQPIHSEIAHGLIGLVDDRLQEKIGLFELVVERVVAL